MPGMSWFRRLGAVVTAVTLALLPTVAHAQQKPAAGYAGSEACMDCHKKTVGQFAESGMGKLTGTHARTEHEKKGCESCHGPAKAHAESGGEDMTGMTTFGRKSKTPVADRNATCLQCHEKTARTLWKGSTHEARNVACTDCHSVMHPGTERGGLKRATVLATCGNCHKDKQAAVTKYSHMPLGEGKMECSSCHSPHGSPNEKLLIASSANETCFGCHAEKRGPFMWEHLPVTENCANCHDSHGSNKQRMLKLPLPRLCQQCHNTPHGAPSGRPSDQANVRFNYNKGCVNCHSVIHGSNHPAGAFFTR
jgi:DmsE family decaheme c-type cytochrome